MRMEDSDMLNVACYVELQVRCSEQVKFRHTRIILRQDIVISTSIKSFIYARHCCSVATAQLLQS